MGTEAGGREGGAAAGAALLKVCGLGSVGVRQCRRKRRLLALAMHFNAWRSFEGHHWGPCWPNPEFTQ